MRKGLCLLLLFCLFGAAYAEAGQYRVSPPSNMRKRQPPRGYRDSYLQITNDDDRGYAIDTDYRRNRLTLVSRSRGDIYLPAHSSITLVFDDDDNWYFEGDYESLEIQIRSGRTTTLRLETKKNRHQIGLFGTVDDGRRRYSKQLFKYAERKPPVVVVQPTHPRPGPSVQPIPTHPRPPVVVQPVPPRPVHSAPPPPAPIRPYNHYNEPSTGAIIGSVVGGIVGGLIDNDKDKDRHHNRR